MPERKIKQIFEDLQGRTLLGKTIPKFYRDILVHVHGSKEDGHKRITSIDPENPLNGSLLKPHADNPICRRCELDTPEVKNPYLPYSGPENPLITILFDSVSPKEDVSKLLASDGPAGFLKKLIGELAPVHGINVEDIRWVPLTRCAARQFKVNFVTKANWCRNYAVQDILNHPPRLLVPMGSAALGMLSHKSNVQDWGGRVLIYRGWPDDWITNPQFMLPRPHPADPENQTIVGHPLFGRCPENFRLPIYPLQVPRLVYMTRSPQAIKRWKQQVDQMLSLAVNGVKTNVFDRPWWKLTEDPAVVASYMDEIRKNPGMVVSFDTETTGLKPWHPNESIVFMMFRYTLPDGTKRAIGFPWDFAESALKPHLEGLAPLVMEALYCSKLVGHNLSFDVLFTIANVLGADLVRLTNAACFDTWHMAYTSRQQTGTLGLDMIAHQWVPDLAGYEEDMTLLIQLYPELLDPGAGKGGHYARCPKPQWETHLKPYVMGDVEVCYEAFGKLEEKLKKAETYRIPLAHPTNRGRFRYLQPPGRHWVYHKIISPASQMLQRLMARGMHVDLDELSLQEDLFPKKIRETREMIKRAEDRTDKITNWCNQNVAQDPSWEFDPENKEQLKFVLFDPAGLNLPIQRLTPGGKKIHGEDPKLWESLTHDELIKYAALDKYTLNMLAVNHPEVRPLQEYRKVFKQYTTYVRPMRNAFAKGIDKKHRDAAIHLGRDGCVHPSFKLTSTKSGRLGSSDPNVQQIPREGLIKRLYNSRFGKSGSIYQADLSQIELRLIAAACGDPAMINAYHKGIDLHALTHSNLFQKPYEECTNDYQEWLQKNGKADQAKKLKEERKIAKTSNFLTSYGGGAFGLQTSLAQQGIYFQIEQCEEILARFFDGYPTLRKFLSYYKKFIMDNGVAVSVFGRVRIFEEVYSDDKEAISKALRAGCNHVIQSTASDLMLIMLTVIETLMRQHELQSMVVSTVHDSLIIDSLIPELDAVHEIVFSVLNNMPEVLKLVFGDGYDISWILVPLAGDSELGLNMADCVKIPNQITGIDWEKLLASSKKI